WQALQQATHRSLQADVDLGQTQLYVAVGFEGGQLDVVHADHLATAGVDDLLVQKIFLNGQPRLIRLVHLESPLANVQSHRTGLDRGHLIVAGYQRLKAPARQQEVRDAVGRRGRFDEELAHPADEVALQVPGVRAHQFSGVKLHTHPQSKTRNPQAGQRGCGQVSTTIELTVSPAEALPARRRATGPAVVAVGFALEFRP